MRPGSLAVAGFAQGSLGGSLKHYQRTPKAPGTPRELGFAGWGLALRVASPPATNPPPSHRQEVVHGPGSLGLRSVRPCGVSLPAAPRNQRTTNMNLVVPRLFKNCKPLFLFCFHLRTFA